MAETVRSLHDQAMALAELGMVAKHNGRLDEARGHYAKAYPIEVEALEIVREAPNNEPTWSILCVSAASLAANAGLYDAAEQWIAAGWLGDPSPKQRRDLYEVREWIDELKETQP